VRAFGHNFDLVIERKGEGLHLTVTEGGKTVTEQDLAAGGTVEVVLKK
jgi:hypothetical protein